MFKIGKFYFLTYGLISALGWVCSYLSAQVFGIRMNLSTPREVSRFFILNVFPFGFGGARVLSIILDDGMKKLFTHPIKTIFRPGLWYHGAIIGIFIGILVRAPVYGYSYLYCFDCLAVVGICYDAVSRLACHCYGCCYGRLAKEGECAIVYTNPDSTCVRLDPSLKGKKIVPAQLFGFVIYTVIFFVLFATILFVDINQGVVTGICFLAHFIGRVIHEKFRIDNRVVIFAGVTSSMIIGFVMALSGLVFSIYCQYVFKREYNKGSFVLMEFLSKVVTMLKENIIVLTVLFLVSFSFFGIHRHKVGCYVNPDEKKKSGYVLIKEK